MKWSDTIASGCRYGEHAAEVFGEAKIVCEDSYDDYQGYARILALMPDGRYAYYEWDYGSCSGCDTWESTSMSDENIVQEMLNDTVYFDTWAELKKFFKKRPKFLKSVNGLDGTLLNHK